LFFSCVLSFFIFSSVMFLSLRCIFIALFIMTKSSLIYYCIIEGDW
jgi:hypothetical protein